ncbi:MAG TPA: hypothetical protein VGX92_02525 [Pyrinomonadaceae bacterium]|jgi:hypothetical protein|nr:hypothetical protein [Pyrinomonadaceae bacterium]
MMTTSSIPLRPDPPATRRPASLVSFLSLFALAVLALTGVSLAGQQQQQQSSPPLVAPASSARTFPKEIRGYKVERARVEIKKQRAEKSRDQSPGAAQATTTTTAEPDALIQFGAPRVAKMTPLGITLEVPVTVAAVKQGGRVDFLSFEDMVVNGTPVTIEDYLLPFDLPNKRAVLLPAPVRVFISTPRALLGALGEWSASKEEWPVTGRVYVFGRFKKFLFSFKRVVPVELSLTLPNPLRNTQTTSDPAIKQETQTPAP